MSDYSSQYAMLLNVCIGMSIAIRLHTALNSSIKFSRSEKIQRFFIGDLRRSGEAIVASKLILLNYSGYDLFWSANMIYATYFGENCLLRVLLYICICNEVSICYSYPFKWSARLLTKACLVWSLSWTALWLLPRASRDESATLPSVAVLIPSILHCLFCGLESFAFPRMKSVQKMFLGKKLATDDAIAATIPMFFNQGMYNLFLALGSFYGYFVMRNVALVESFLIIYSSASFLLMYSNSKAVGGAFIQGGPALAALLYIHSL